MQLLALVITICSEWLKWVVERLKYIFFLRIAASCHIMPEYKKVSVVKDQLFVSIPRKTRTMNMADIEG